MDPAAATVRPLEAQRLRWFQLLVVVLSTLVGIALVLAALIAIARSNRGFYRANLETISLLATLGIYLGVAVGILAALRRLPAPLAYLKLRLPTPADLGLTLLLLVPWYAGIVLVSLLSSIVLNGGRQVQGNSRLVFVQPPNGVGVLLLALLVTAVAAPVCEEIVFRGMLFRLLRERTSFWLAVLVSALAFGLAHASPAISLALLPTFAYMGIVLAVVYARTGSLTNSMLLHGINNALVTILAFTLPVR
jgi:membrane protease YdiL (CAAX protease family)